MSDLSAIRSRRRYRGTDDTSQYTTQGGTAAQLGQTAINFDFQQPEVKEHNFQQTVSTSINTVFGASTTQLWNSAQEAFSSFQPSYYLPTSSSFSNLPPSEPEEPASKDPELIWFGKEEKIPANMPSRDRTTEFKTTAKSFQMKQQGNGFPQASHKNGVINESIQFNQIAKRIGRDMSLTCAKMERLAELAKKKSLFNDGHEVEGLSKDITEAIKALNKQIAALQEYSRKRNGQTTSKQGQGHSNLVVVGLQSKLANVSKDFQTVLEVRTENLKHQKSRREMFSMAGPEISSLPTSSGTPMIRSRLLDDDASAGGSVTLNMDLLAPHQSQQVYADQSTAYAQARSDTMALIEGSVSELGQIFSQLARLVSEQGEMIERIDSNVEDTAINIDAAHTEILRYFHSISQNRWLMIKMRVSAALIVWSSFAMTAATVTHAFLIHKQFYPSIVYLTKSNASMAVIYTQAIILAYLVFQLMRRIFFGDLRASESEHLSERTYAAIMETCLAFTVFRDEFNSTFVMQFGLLLFVKAFHWLSEDRVDMMERSPVITLKFHLRMMALVCLLGGIDSFMVSHAYFTTLIRGASAQIVFGFEYAILMTVVFHVTIKYVLHMHDLRSATQWENKTVYMLHTELFINAIRCGIYFCFMAFMLKVHTFPLFAVRPFYHSLRDFKKALADVVLSRRAINAMNNRFPVVSAEELSRMDATCIICREEMTVESAPKRLPCNHVFHSNCLRSWFQRQQTCPTCRTNILNNVPTAPAQNAAPGANNNAMNNNNNGVAFGNVQGMAMRIPPNFFPLMAHQFAHQPPPVPPQNAERQNQQGGEAQAEQPMPDHAPFTMPPFMFQPPPPPPMFGMPGMFPPPPFPFPPRPSFSGLTDEELRQLEGNTRGALEARIQTLSNISSLLDAAVLQMQQYISIVSMPLTSFNATETPSTSERPNDTPTTTPTPTIPTPKLNTTFGPSSSNSGITASSNSEAEASSTKVEPSDEKATTSDIGPNGDDGEMPPSTSENTNDPLDAMRQRRLQKFAKTE
ncbi:unnamed protein product, partial [Mesorhabditis belari]|uniref:E3 ubiquitin-protein ligase hrd-1 n=1 Tax=Mesorhabditis belari TaxID=2138241 RepID=A0AAF3FQD5_9BILA